MTDDVIDFGNLGDIHVSDVQRLLMCERQLLKEEKWLVEALKAIKTERISLNVERMQLQSLISSANIVETTSSNAECQQEKEIEGPISKQLDEVDSSYNTKQLDLSIVSDLNDILKGEFYADEETSEEENSEEDNS